jgi:hypothetical protein
MTYLHIQPKASVTVLQKLPHGSAFGVRVLPELPRYGLQIHCWLYFV